MPERRVDQIYPHHPERFLLLVGFHIEQADMQEDVGRGIARLELKAQPHPAEALARVMIAARPDGVAERKERRGVAAFRTEPFDQDAILMVEHLLQALA